MDAETYLVAEKWQFLMNTSFLIKDYVKILQVKQDTIRHKCFQNINGDSASGYVHMRCDTPSPYTQL